MTFYITKAGLFMKISGQQIIWIENKEAANKYPSRYAAKKHAKNVGLEEYEVING